VRERERERIHIQKNELQEEGLCVKEDQGRERE